MSLIACLHDEVRLTLRLLVTEIAVRRLNSSVLWRLDIISFLKPLLV